MKIRTDFVTNSSSSSFILAFKDRESAEKLIKEEIPADIQRGYSYGQNGYIGQLLEEFDDEDNQYTKETIAKYINQEIDYTDQYEFVDQYAEEHNMDYFEAKKFILKTEEGKALYAAHRAEVYEQMLSKIKEDDNFIVVVDHGDGGEGEDGVLEHQILPKLSCTVAQFSHH